MRRTIAVALIALALGLAFGMAHHAAFESGYREGHRDGYATGLAMGTPPSPAPPDEPFFPDPSPLDECRAQLAAARAAGPAACRAREGAAYWRGANDWYALGREDWRVRRTR